MTETEEIESEGIPVGETVVNVVVKYKRYNEEKSATDGRTPDMTIVTKTN